MSKSAKACLCAIAGVGALVGAVSSAQADHWRHGGCCGPQPTRHVYQDISTHSDIYHHINKWHRYPVDVTRLTVHVTRIHPVISVHNLVTIHEQPYPVIIDQSKNETVTEAATYTYVQTTATVQEPCRCPGPVCQK